MASRRTACMATEANSASRSLRQQRHGDAQQPVEQRQRDGPGQDRRQVVDAASCLPTRASVAHLNE